jgi:hypothetical protein
MKKCLIQVQKQFRGIKTGFSTNGAGIAYVETKERTKRKKESWSKTHLNTKWIIDLNIKLYNF